MSLVGHELSFRKGCSMSAATKVGAAALRGIRSTAALRGIRSEYANRAAATRTGADRQEIESITIDGGES